MRVALYARVSTDQQTTDNQLQELQAIAIARDWTVVRKFEDRGISGSKGRDARPGLDSLLRIAAAGEIDMVAAWSVDRLGRSLSNLVAFLSDLQAAGVGLYLHQQALDTSTPSGRAMFGMLGVFAEFERAMIQERVNSGLKRAKLAGTKLGRPCALSEDDQRELYKRYRLGEHVDDLANEYGVTQRLVYRALERCRVS